MFINIFLKMEREKGGIYWEFRKIYEICSLKALSNTSNIKKRYANYSCSTCGHD